VIAVVADNLGRDLVESEPLVRITKAVAQVGQTARDFVEPYYEAAKRYISPKPPKSRDPRGPNVSTRKSR
jgi:hypothetical protein